MVYHGEQYIKKQVDTMENNGISWTTVYQKAGGYNRESWTTIYHKASGYNGESWYIMDNSISVGRWV